ADERGVTIAHVGKIFIEMLHDVGAAAERCEHIDETEHLHFEMFVAHRKLHHPLIESGLAENRFRMAIDQIKDLGAASLNLGLQETHVRIVNRASLLGKSRLLTLSVVTPKADIAFMLITPDLHAANSFEKRLNLSLGAGVLEPVYSYLSLTEESEYTTTAEQYAETLTREQNLKPGTPEFDT